MIDLYSMLNSAYFIIFRRKSWPPWQQVFLMLVTEVVNVISTSVFVFACAPFLSKSFNALTNVLLMAIPLVLSNAREIAISRCKSFGNVYILVLPFLSYTYIIGLHFALNRNNIPYVTYGLWSECIISRVVQGGK